MNFFQIETLQFRLMSIFTQTRIIKHPISCDRHKTFSDFSVFVIVTVLSVGIYYGNILNGLVEENVVEVCWIYEGSYCFWFHCATLIY